MRLGAPQMANGIDAKRGIQDEKGSSDAGEQETAQSLDPAAVQESHHERERQAGKDNGDIITILPHHHGILFEFGGIFVVFMGILPEQPSAMTVPEPQLSIVRVLFLVAPGVMADVIRCPFEP